MCNHQSERGIRVDVTSGFSLLSGTRSLDERKWYRNLRSVLFLLFVFLLTTNAFAQKRVLFVSGSDNAADRRQRELLEDLGFQVEVVDDDQVVDADAAGKDLVYISESVDGAPVADNFFAFTGGVVNNESFALGGMKWTGPTPGSDYGNSGGLHQRIVIEDTSHPIASGLSGTVRILDDPRLFTWGSPSAEASVIAHVNGHGEQKAIFAYEAGATMVGAVAAGRRVFFPFAQDGIEHLTADGRALFDAGVLWASSAVSPYDCSAQSDIPNSECEALVALYQSTNGRNWNRNDGWLTTNPSSWFRIEVTGGHVTEIRLDGNNLTGSIPPQLGNLVHLTHLELRYNSELGGAIPPELGNLVHVTQLLLEYNQHTGAIPPALEDMEALEWLGLGGNQLTGSIPAELGNLSHLRFLYLHDNQLTGSIPASFGRLTDLSELLLASNQLSGPLPATLGNLTQLEYLQLHNNQLSGQIPSSFGNLTRLQWINLSDNLLSGRVPYVFAQVAAGADGGGCESYCDLTGNTTLCFPNTADYQALDNPICGLPLSTSCEISDTDYDALFVSGEYHTADQAQRHLLDDLGYTVRVVYDNQVVDADADGMELVYISESVDGENIEDNFHSFTGGVVNNESYALDGMKWTGPTPGTDFGNSASQMRSVVIEEASHPMAAGLSGRVRILTDPVLFTWGAPGDRAAVIAHLEGSNSRKAIFAYEAGARMVGATAAGRRVFLPFCQNGASVLTSDGRALFEAGVLWAGGRLETEETPLEAPVLVSPFNGATDVDIHPTFSWRSVSGATSYQLKVSRQENLASPLLDRNTTGTTDDDVELAATTTYYWSVTSQREGESAESDIWSFTTGSGPNSSPIAEDDSLTVPVDVESVLDVLSNDVDSDGDVLRISGVTNWPLNGTASFTATAILYRPHPGFIGNDVLTYAVEDGRGGTAEGRVFIEVAIQTAGSTEYPEGVTRLYPNYPNPFSSHTNVVYSLAAPGHVRLELLDVLGRTVRVLEEGARSRGIREVDLDGSSLPVGMYVVRLQTSETTQTRPISVTH